jgi:hypothetical protein
LAIYIITLLLSASLSFTTFIFPFMRENKKKLPSNKLFTFFVLLFYLSLVLVPSAAMSLMSIWMQITPEDMGASYHGLGYIYTP